VCSERFYYVNDLYDTTTNTWNSNYAVLIYYKNISNDNVQYNATDKQTTFGPKTAKTYLPTTAQWSNVSLSNVNRAVLTDSATSSVSGASLPTAFSYAGYAARLLTYQELSGVCRYGYLSTCKNLMENTKFSNSSFPTLGYWLETVRNTGPYDAWTIDASAKGVNPKSVTASSSDVGVRPAIEVLKTNIEY